MTMVSDQVGEWLTLRGAAARLNLSEKTLRRRVKAGAVQARQVSTQHGQAWEVWVDGGQPTLSTVDGQGTQPVSTPELLEALRLVRDQQQIIIEMSGRLGYLQAELGQARERILALEAPKVEPMPIEPTPAVAGPPAPVVRPWWRRWIGRDEGVRGTA